MSDTIADEAKTNATDLVVKRAHARFVRCQKWESIARSRWMMDRKFANGDAYNNYQWPDDIQKVRGDRPSLTVNETQQHNLHIINEAKQNKASVKYRPIGDGASPEAATVMEGIYRHIQNISNAQMVQGTAISFQVEAGLGFTVIRAKHIDQKSFDQDIYIQTIDDPMSCYLDCDAREPDGSNSRYGFIFSDRPRDEVVEEYPQFKNKGAPQNAVEASAGWIRDDHIREAEYYEVSEKKDELLGDDSGTTIMRSQMTPDLIRAWRDELEAKGEKLRRRPVIRKSVHWYKIIGDEVVDDEPVPGLSVPIIPWVGTVTIIDGTLDRKGHTRTMISPQQIMNYNWSASIEFGALQSKTPYLAAAKAIEGYETYWRVANTENFAYLPWNHVSDDGITPIPEPKRQEPPTGAPVFMEGIQTAKAFMLSASGQYEAEMGAQGNERSGRAINERQRQGDRATYHFIDNQALAIRRQGQIVQEWLPEIYDTARVVRVIGEDGSESQVRIDPQAAAAHQAVENEAISAILNPNIGKYEVVSDVGPDYATERQEAFQAIVQILTQAPELINKIGDLLFKVADFPLADQIAERLQPGLSPEAQQAVAQLQAELQDAQKKGMNSDRLLHEAMQALAEERLKVKAKDSDNTIDAFDADTKRLAVVKDMIPIEPEAMRALVAETVRQALQDNLGPIVASLKNGVLQDTTEAGSPESVDALPIRVPDVGQQAATPGGM